jgi:hypothetical protein
MEHRTIDTDQIFTIIDCTSGQGRLGSSVNDAQIGAKAANLAENIATHSI